jgi:hypothetical protein
LVARDRQGAYCRLGAWERVGGPQTCKIDFVLPDPEAKLPFQRPFAKAPCTTGALSAAASAWHSNWQLIRPAPI